jgi:hypothetical protein
MRPIECGVPECDREASTVMRRWPTGGVVNARNFVTMCNIYIYIYIIYYFYVNAVQGCTNVAPWKVSPYKGHEGPEGE